MNLEKLSYSDLNDTLQKIKCDLKGAENELVQALESIANQGQCPDQVMRFRIEELRFKRKVLRSEYMDVSAWLKIVKREHFELRLMGRLLNSQPAIYETILARIHCTPSSASLEISILHQKRIKLYRNLRKSFDDQMSMMQQKFMAEMLGKADKDWETRLESALLRSKHYFSRQGDALERCRSNLSRLSRRSFNHMFYKAAVEVLGCEQIDVIMGQRLKALVA